MAESAKKKKNNLSIYLIKEEVAEFDKIVKDCVLLKTYNDGKKLYYRGSISKQPEWAKGFFGQEFDDMFQSNVRAVLIVKVSVNEMQERIFAVTFGYGRNLLQDDVCEEQFGLKIVLNTVPKNNLRKISKADVGNNQKQSQEQLPKESNIMEFGFDEKKELIKYVTGRCVDEQFDNAIVTGGDMLSVVADKTITDIENFLKYCFQVYGQTTYRTNYAWVDNYKFIKSKTLIEELNQKIVNYFNAKNFDFVWLAVPEVIEWEKISGFRISGCSDIEQDIDSEKFLSTFSGETITDFKQLSNKIIKAMSREDDNDFVYCWSASRCLVGSLEHNNKRYAINFGKWYEIDNDFATEVNEEYEEITLSQIPFNKYENETEEQFIDKTITTLQSSNKIHPIITHYGGGSGNGVEPCDIVYGNNLIYLKKYGGSEHLSHLFMQATVASEALTDEKFRNKTNQELASKQRTFQFPTPFEPNNYKIVVGILSDKTGVRPKIPFFSMVSIRTAMRSIQSRGYTFEIVNISSKNEPTEEIIDSQTQIL